MRYKLEKVAKEKSYDPHEMVEVQLLRSQFKTIIDCLNESINNYGWRVHDAEKEGRVTDADIFEQEEVYLANLRDQIFEQAYRKIDWMKEEL